MDGRLFDIFVLVLIMLGALSFSLYFTFVTPARQTKKVSRYQTNAKHKRKPRVYLPRKIRSVRNRDNEYIENITVGSLDNTDYVENEKSDLGDRRWMSMLSIPSWWPFTKLTAYPVMERRNRTDKMRYERLRLASFHNVPKQSLPHGCPSPVSLAAKGFFFNNSRNQTTCWSCGVPYATDVHHVDDCFGIFETDNFPFIVSPPASTTDLNRLASDAESSSDQEHTQVDAEELGVRLNKPRN